MISLISGSTLYSNADVYKRQVLHSGIRRLPLQVPGFKIAVNLAAVNQTVLILFAVKIAVLQGLLRHYKLSLFMLLCKAFSYRLFVKSDFYVCHYISPSS